jgi:FkbM family methyltransferase
MTSPTAPGAPRPILRRSTREALRCHLAVLLFKRLTRHALPLFVRGGDIISSAPQALGSHEPQVAGLLESFARDGHRDFLIDVGANIGLTSCQSGPKFARVEMFEPNPLCAGVLRTNAAIALDRTPHTVHPFGLGTRDERLTLRVPRNNWGGAYVVTPDNDYDCQTLLAKDGFTRDDAANYLTLGIEIRDAVETFRELFARLVEAGARRGAVKIDVEGLESVVLRAIAETTPPELSLFVVFEHWGGSFDAAPLLASFGERATLHALVKSPSGAHSALGKLWAIVASGGQAFVLQRWTSGSQANDLVLEVRARAHPA